MREPSPERLNHLPKVTQPGGSRINRHPASQSRVFLLECRSLPIHLLKTDRDLKGKRERATLPWPWRSGSLPLQNLWYFPPLKLYIPNLSSSAAQFDFGLGQLPPLPGPCCLLHPLPRQSHGSRQEGTGGLLRRRTTRCPESSTEGPLGPPGPALADFSSWPSDTSSYSSLPGIHLGPPGLFSHPHTRSTHLNYF